MTRGRPSAGPCTRRRHRVAGATSCGWDPAGTSNSRIWRSTIAAPRAPTKLPPTVVRCAGRGGWRGSGADRRRRWSEGCDAPELGGPHAASASTPVDDHCGEPRPSEARPGGATTIGSSRSAHGDQALRSPPKSPPKVAAAKIAAAENRRHRAVVAAAIAGLARPAGIGAAVSPHRSRRRPRPGSLSKNDWAIAVPTKLRGKRRQEPAPKPEPRAAGTPGALDGARAGGSPPWSPPGRARPGRRRGARSRGTCPASAWRA